MHGNELLKKKFYYLKMPKDWFKNARIKKLRKIAGGDTYTIIYLKLLLLSINHNNCFIYEGIENSVAKEIALKLDEDENNVEITLEFLKSNGLWEESNNNEFHLVEADGMVGSETYSNILKKNSGLEKFQPHSNQILTIKEIELEKDIDKENIVIDRREILFNQFYDAYPRKIGRDNALKSWNRIPDVESLYDTIMDSLERYKHTKQWQDKQYIPHPSTWLNQHRWKDEIDDVKKDVLDDWASGDFYGC